MGVPGFTTYINKRQQFLFNDQIKIRNSCLVFDGSALIWALVKKAPGRHYGGDYDVLYYHMKRFFDTLRSLEVDAYIVCDGGNNISMKMETIMKRREDLIQRVRKMNIDGNGDACRDLPLPLFLQSLFKEILLDTDTKHVVVEQEADLSVACLANQLNGFVVTNDSDFYLFDIQNGVINLGTFMNCIETKHDKCQYYHRKNLASYLEVEERILPCLALVLGNDYSVPRYLSRLETRCDINDRRNVHRSIDSILGYIKRTLKSKENDNMTSLLNGLCQSDEEMKKQLSKELQEFDVEAVKEKSLYYLEILKQPKSMGDILATSHGNDLSYITSLVNNMLIESSVLDMVFYRTHFVSVQCEWTKRKASSVYSALLRQVIYSLLHTNGDFNEYRRRSEQYKCRTIQLKPSISLQTLLQSTVEERRKFMFEILNIPTRQSENLMENSSQAILFLLALRYFVEMREKFINVEVQTLLLTLSTCQAGYFCDDSPTLDRIALHLYASFRSILFYIMILNKLLGEPLPHPKISILLSGSKLQCIHADLKTGKDCQKKYLVNENQIREYEDHLNFIKQQNPLFTHQPQLESEEQSQPPTTDFTSQSVNQKKSVNLKAETDQETNSTKLANKFGVLSLE